jgi:hypothetical protein
MKSEEVDKGLSYDGVTGRWIKKIAEIVAEAGRAEDYEKYFMKNMGKTGFTSITDMPKEKRKKFFHVVNKGWKSKEEKRKAVAQQEAAGRYSHVGVPDTIDEKAPPGFPKKLYHKIKKQYPGNPQAAYATMWKVDKSLKETALDEVAPPGFPKKIYKKVKSQYPGEPEKAYATMWKIHNQMKEEWDDAEVLDKAPGQDAKDWYSEQKLKETSGTGGAPGYSTPFAFSGGKSGNEKRRKNTATVGTGYKLAKGDE